MTGLKFLLVLFACVLAVTAFEANVDSDSDAENFIIGGRDARPGQFPFIVSLRSPQNVHFCGGFILSNQWIATAGHCTQLSRRWSQNVIAYTGAHTQTDGQRHAIARITVHPQYNGRQQMYDISILRTATKIQFNARVRPVQLPRGPTVHDGTTLYIAGWGNTRVMY